MGSPTPTGNIEFNVQSFLADMRAESRQDLREVSAEVQQRLESLNESSRALQSALVDHTAEDFHSFAELSARLAPVERLTKSMTWVLRSVVLAIIAGVFDLFIHLASRR